MPLNITSDFISEALRTAAVSVEKNGFPVPDANITIDFALVRLTNILDNMIVYPKKML